MVRGSNKAYDEDDQLKGEYSISLFGVKYPLVTEKGSFTSKNSKKGKQRRNKLLNASRQDKEAYIYKVKSLFNIFDEKKELGDTKENLHPVQVQESNNKIYHKHASKGNLPSNQVPDSLEAFKKDAETAKQNKEEEPEDKSLLKQEALKKEQEDEENEKTKQAIQSLLPQQKKFSKGGYLQGKSHKQGGIKMKLKHGGTLDGQPVENVELEDEEFVVNKESTKHFKNELEQINNAGNAVRDSKGTPQETAQMSRLQKLKNKL